jgi:hypothetical protein
MALLAACVLTCAAADSAPDAEVSSPPAEAGELQELIARLDSNRYLERERATQELLTVGAAALDPLLAAANSNLPEPADRAVWVLRKMSESTDRELALAALDRLVAVNDRPAVVQEATLARGRIYELACQESLAKLGARMVVIDQLSPEQTPVRLVHVDLTDKWQGTADDLQCLTKLRDHHYFRIEGTAVGDDEVQVFAGMDGLALLQIWKTKVTPTAVDAIKDRQPKAVIYVRRNALLGIQGASHEKGVLVTESRPNTGAANGGILKDDVIMLLDGKPVKDFDRLTAQIAQYEPGEEIEVTLLRGDQELTKRVTLSDWKNYE